MSKIPVHPIPDTLFESEPTRSPIAQESSRSASLVEHLTELRYRLLISMSGLLIVFFCCFFLAQPLYNILIRPYAIHAGPEAQLIYTAPLEYFTTQIKVAFFAACCISFPLIAYQFYIFIAPGLYAQERQAFVPYLIATPVFFLSGAAMVYFLIMPLVIQFSLSQQQKSGDTAEAAIVLLPKVSEYLALMMNLILAFGFCFQLPILLSLLARAGFVTAPQLRAFRKHALIVSFIIAAIITPPDVLSQCALAIPTYLLYEISIFAIGLSKKK